MPMCEPQNTELSRTIEKEILNQVDEAWAANRQKTLSDLYFGKPPPLRSAGRRAIERPPTPKWLFRGNAYHGITTKEARDKQVLDALATERLALERQSGTERSLTKTGSRASVSSEDATETPWYAKKKEHPPPGFGGCTMSEWSGHMKTLPGGQNWIDR
eukprot:TRINITY_DN43212_c0_g1_i1.p1 TRINITY_DN43212_c0_g1~~TRINITY_DN43212_c0_g1_i1.p1  ORF type:complete len:159 (-),score=25.00 TRINITY_DN43212_c0_g1_i1:8-484(-)